MTVFDPSTTDNDTLTVTDTAGVGLNIACNMSTDGTLDTAGLRILSDADYTAWKAGTLSDTKGIRITGGLTSVENIVSAGVNTVTATDLNTLKSDVTAWLTAHTDYANVSGALADSGTDTNVTELVAIFDNFNAGLRTQ